VAVLTLANQLTIARIALFPVFVLLVIYGHAGWALAVFATAGITDGLDGLIARRTGSRTSLGAWLDPMADKLLLVSTFVVLTIPAVDVRHHVPLWLTVLMITRDVLIVGVVALVNVAMGPRTFRPSLLGKVATTTYILTAVAFLYYNWRDADSVVIDAAVWCTLVLTLASGIDYIVRLRRLVNQPAG
jgi:cardiolipin synthase